MPNDTLRSYRKKRVVRRTRSGHKTIRKHIVKIDVGGSGGSDSNSDRCVFN